MRVAGKRQVVAVGGEAAQQERFGGVGDADPHGGLGVSRTGDLLVPGAPQMGIVGAGQGVGARE